MCGPMFRVIPALALLLGTCVCSVGTTLAGPPRVLPEGQLPKDQRRQPLVNLNGYFPFTPPTDKAQWQLRADRLRRQLLVATGLWPMPTATPADAVIHGRVDREGYSVEKVYLQSFPGHFVTGSLYRPTGRSGRLPGVLCPHGHWKDGRFYDAGPKQIRKQLVEGAERFEFSGRFPLQARCVQLARMGCVVFHYDMVGYADSLQLQHRPGMREAMNTPQNWGYFSPQAEARLQHQMGLQTYNSIRALDWFSQLPDVDPRRIGVTGASGGGTQTFILGAVDSRPAVAFPAVMVSTAMQGGCTCENCCYLRVGTGNIEIAALFAPRPLGMTAANDWTKEIETKGLPELKALYKLLGVEKLVMAKPLVHFPHNYNYVSRAVMYSWLNTHLKLGQEEPIVETDFQPLSVEELTVWDAQHPKPPSGDDYERSLLRWITQDNDQQMQALTPCDRQSFNRYRDVVGGAVDILLGRPVPAAGEVRAMPSATTSEAPPGQTRIQRLLLQYASCKEEVPALLLTPPNWNKQVVIWISRHGKQSLYEPASDRCSAAVSQLLNSGSAVLGLDLFGQGEFTADGAPVQANRLNASGQKAWATYAGYTYGYNYPLFVQRVHDILTAVGFARHELKAERVNLLGLEGAGHWVVAARAQAGAAIDRAAADTAGFRFAALTAIDAPDFLPGGAKYLDLPGLIALSAPYPLWISGETDLPLAQAAYHAAEKPQAFVVCAADASQRAADAVAWLLQ